MEEALWSLTRNPSQERWLLMSKELCMLHQLYIEYIKAEIQQKHKQNVELSGNSVMFCGV